MNDARSLGKKFKSITNFNVRKLVSLEKSDIKGIAFSTPRLPILKKKILSPNFGSSRRVLKKEDFLRLSVLGPLPPLSLKSKFRDCIRVSPIKLKDDDNELLDDIDQLLKEVK